MLHELPYNGVDWKAITNGEPGENEQLMELIRLHATSRADLMQFIEDMLAQKLSLNSDALDKLNALGRQLEELAQSGDIADIFSTLGDLLERLDESESNLRDAIDDHNSDFDSHLNDRDRETLDNAQADREAADRALNQLTGALNALQSRADDSRDILNNQMQTLTRHMTDSSVHFDSRAQKDSALAMKIIEFTSGGREFPLVFTPAETGINSDRINVRVEQLANSEDGGGSYISRNDTVSIDSDGAVRVQAIQPFDGRITIITDFKLFWGNGTVNET